MFGMADFRQLALEFVLAEEQAKLTSLAKSAAYGLLRFHKSLSDRILTFIRDPIRSDKQQPRGSLGRVCSTMDAR